MIAVESVTPLEDGDYIGELGFDKEDIDTIRESLREGTKIMFKQRLPYDVTLSGSLVIESYDRHLMTADFRVVGEKPEITQESAYE